MVLRRKPEEDAQPKPLEVDASMTGTLSFKDPVNLQINGRFDGALEVRGVLTIGAAAQVKATISGERITIAGSVEGPVTASQRLELLSSARVVGKVTKAKLIVHEGATLHGTCEMTSESSPKQWMTLEELARYLEVDDRTIMEWAQTGRVPGQQDAGQWRFDRGLVETWLAQEKIK